MEQLRGLVPPGVFAAIIRTWLHGWCSVLRFQVRSSSRIWGCPLAQGDLKQYVSSRRLLEVAAQALQLPTLAGGGQRGRGLPAAAARSG